jgi:LmbE family N-acetylglucosaminyl deacetylase
MEPVPEDWERALAIVAHPDDMEYGAASAVARWTDQGKSVTYVLATRGENGIDALEPEECARVREAEELAGAAAVGVAAVEFLTHEDGLVEYGHSLRRDFALAIRRHRPDVLITLHYGERWGGGWLNMADHRHVGLAALDAARDAANKWLFGGTRGPKPWGGVRFALVAGAAQPTHFVDISDHLEQGIASLAAHAQYLTHIGTDARAFLTEMATQAGSQCSVRYATQFELISL